MLIPQGIAACKKGYRLFETLLLCVSPIKSDSDFTSGPCKIKQNIPYIIIESIPAYIKHHYGSIVR